MAYASQADMDELLSRAKEVLGCDDDAACRWMDKKNPWLNARTPREAVEAGDVDEVMLYLNRVDYGLCL